MSHILIYGAPGAGKTTSSKILHEETNLPLVEGDSIADFIGTKRAWREYGALTEENVIKGLHSVREFMRSNVDNELAKYDEVIFEGSFIDPTRYHKGTSIFLVVTPDETKHRKQFFTYAKRAETEEMKENFLAVRMIQEYLIEEAEDLGIKIIQNTSDPEVLLKQF